MTTTETLKGTEKVDRGVIVYHDEQILVSGVKKWRSATEYTIANLQMTTRPQPKDEIDTHDWLWDVFDGVTHFADIDRKIDISWGSGWNKLHGSLPALNLLEEELRKLDVKFFDSIEEENEAIAKGDWNRLVEAHLVYFKDILKSIMNKHVDVLVNEDAIATAFHAICEFAKKLYEDGETLRARFRTAAYSWVWWFYQEELKRKDVINQSTSAQKLKDKRTLNQFLKTFWGELNRTPTLSEIKKGLGWGENRFQSTFRLFDFNISKHRPMNDDEMLYTVMQEHLTERQASILEMNFALNGSKYSLHEIADELNISYDTVQSDRKKGMSIIKEHLGFKFN